MSQNILHLASLKNQNEDLLPTQAEAPCSVATKACMTEFGDTCPGWLSVSRVPWVFFLLKAKSFKELIILYP